MRYYHNLDGVRGIAALMVVVFHFFTYPNSSYVNHLATYQQITEFGQHGVSMFFVLSGFVITRILINTRNNPDYFKVFYRRRILRILPLYYLFLFVYYSLSPILIPSEERSFVLHLPFYLYYQNFVEVFSLKSSGPGHYWSLAVEEHFYLLWPMIVYLVTPKNLSKVIFITIGLVFILKYFMLRKGLNINFFTFTRIDQILMGAYLAVLEINNFFTRKNSLARFLFLLLLIIPTATIVYVASEKIQILKELTKYIFLGLLFFGLIGTFITLKKENIINRILSGCILQYLGKISYGIYVWHILILLLLNKHLITGVLIADIVLTIGLTIFIAHISFTYYEKFFLSLKDKKLTVRISHLISTYRRD